jgi:hypothetical protein
VDKREIIECQKKKRANTEKDIRKAQKKISEQQINKVVFKVLCDF